MSGQQEAPVALSFEDVSSRPRCGCKGPGAENWLRASGYRVPQAPNGVAVDEQGVLVARLATSEFLMESLQTEAAGAARVRASRAALAERSQPADVYPVARQDQVAIVAGSRLNDLLRQVCSVDFAPLLPSGGESVVLTSMIGVGVVAWPCMGPSGPAVTLWCDPSYGHYFWDTLSEVADDINSQSMGSRR